MHFSIIVATNRGPEVLQYLFLNTHKESELIIVDSHYNEETKRWLSEQRGYSQIVYAPCKHSPYNWQRDFSQSLNKNSRRTSLMLQTEMLRPSLRRLL